MTTPAIRAAATRRIRRRAAHWREARLLWSVEGLASQLRDLNLHPSTIAERVELPLSDHRGGLNRALYELREGEAKRCPHMAGYWRAQCVKWLGACRAAPQAREALALVLAEGRA